MFPRVSQKRGKFSAMKQSEEAKAKLAKLKKLEALRAAKANSLPSITPARKKAAVTASKRRSILMLGNDDEEEAGAAKGKGGGLLGSKSVGALGAVREAGAEAMEQLPMALSVENGPADLGSRSLVGFSSDSAVQAGEVEVPTDGLEVVRSLLVTLSYCVAQFAEEEKAKKDQEEASKSRHSRQREMAVLLSKDPSSSSPSMINLGGGGKGVHKVREEAEKTDAKDGRPQLLLFSLTPRTLTCPRFGKVSSMPHMGLHKGGNVRYGGGALSHLKRAKAQDEESDEGDGGIEEGDEDGDDSDYDAEGAVNWEGTGDFREAGGKGNRRKGEKKKEEKAIPDESPNDFSAQTYLHTARDCLVNLVMAVDSDEDGGCAGAIKYKSAQAVIISAVVACVSDTDAVTAGCMLLRFGLSQTAKSRLQQTTFFIERGLPDAVARALRLHEQEAGRVNHEVACLVEELGVNFERMLDVMV